MERKQGGIKKAHGILGCTAGAALSVMHLACEGQCQSEGNRVGEEREGKGDAHYGNSQGG